MRLQEISRGSGSAQSAEELRNLAVAEFMANFALANWAHFYPIVGNAKSSRKADGTITSGARRTIDTTYTAKKNTPAFVNATLKMFGDLIETDIAHERRGQDIGSQRVKDLVNFSGSLGRSFMDALINDEVSSENFSGLIEQATTLNRVLTYGGVNGGALPTGNSAAERKAQEAFIEYLDAAINDIVGGADFITCNGSLKARLGTVGRNFITTTNVKDIYGVEHKVDFFRDVPIVNAGFKADKSGLVIPNDQTVGTSADCTSLVIGKFGEEEFISLATNIGLDVQNLGNVGTKLQTLVEMDVDVVVCDKNALTVIEGIRVVNQ